MAVLEPNLQLSHSSEGVFALRKTRFSQRFFSIVIVFALLGLSLPFSGQSQTASAEYKLKAVFMFNFLQFVDWPASAFPNPKDPIIIGVLGPDPFGNTLEETVKGEVVKGRKIEIRRYKNVKEIEECHVLFISLADTSKLDSILSRLEGRSILTVGDVENFAIDGGMIRFITEKNKIRFRINTASVKTANLSVSSKLLQLAEIVPEKRP